MYLTPFDEMYNACGCGAHLYSADGDRGEASGGSTNKIRATAQDEKTSNRSNPDNLYKDETTTTDKEKSGTSKMSTSVKIGLAVGGVALLIFVGSLIFKKKANVQGSSSAPAASVA